MNQSRLTRIRAAASPIRALAPIVAIAKRVVTGRMWIESEHHEDGPGPTVVMSDRTDVQTTQEGSGPLNHRTYFVRILEPQVTPAELIASFRTDPNRFSPTSFARFDGTDGPMTIGDRFTVRLPGPWDGPVVVADVGERHVKFETREDHMEAGWIRFSCRAEQATLVFEIESFARSGDPLFDVVYHPARIGKLIQTEMWIRVLEAAVEHSGGRTADRPHVQTIIYQGADT